MRSLIRAFEGTFSRSNCSRFFLYFPNVYEHRKRSFGNYERPSTLSRFLSSKEFPRHFQSQPGPTIRVDRYSRQRDPSSLSRCSEKWRWFHGSFTCREITQPAFYATISFFRAIGQLALRRPFPFTRKVARPFHTRLRVPSFDRVSVSSFLSFSPREKVNVNGGAPSLALRTSP